MNQGCNRCRNYVPGESNQSCLISKKHNLHASCLLENSKEMQAWWKKNEKVTDMSELSDMSCFEEREGAGTFKELSNLIEKLDALLEKNSTKK